MAKKRKSTAETAARAVSKGYKKAKNKQAYVIFIAVLLIVVLAAGYWFFFVYKAPDETDSSQGSSGSEGSGSSQGTGAVASFICDGTVQTEELTIRFLELGNHHAGDSTLIKVGDTEVLIDSGSTASSAATTVPEIKKYCTDGILEYVIVTHGDTDHISGFYGTTSAPGIFASFECKTIIDFPLTDKDTSKPTTNISKYIAARDAEVEAGAVHYTALECWNEIDGAQRSYRLADNVTMNILYNYYYENRSPDENNYSVCMLLSQGDYHYLFTGDLEEKGEEYLVEYNQLPKCKLFKGGHHGSPTSSNDCLLSVIRPEVVCVCCCAGYEEYTSVKDNTFPSQAFIDRVSVYTDKVYVTTRQTMESDQTTEKYTSMNGIITVTSNGIDFTVKGSNNDYVLWSTEWFAANRVWNGKKTAVAVGDDETGG